MNIVLLSGGSGKRLWPLSNDIQSKQFLKLIKNDRGEYESMVQRVVHQLKTAHPTVNIFVSCNKSHANILHQQLGDIETIQEPSRRDTFPAIALSAAYLHYQKGMDASTPFIVCPIDVFASSRYFELLAEVEKLTAHHAIGLLGAIPTYPSGKYGYICQKDGIVTGFVEKPSETQAKDLIDQNALWNCGVFGLKIEYVLNYARKYANFDSFESLLAQYSSLPAISFDYEVTEKESSIGSVTYDGIWKDLGTWNTLTEEMSSLSIGSHVLISDDCANTHILNMLNIPIIVQDMKDAVVIASHDGILVSSKHGSSFLKPLADQIQLQPMYANQEWGNYRVLDYKQNGAPSVIKRLRVEAGHLMECPSHQAHSKTWVVVSGKGILTLDGVDSVVSLESIVKIPPKTSHSLLAATTLEVVEIEVISSWG